MSGAEYEWGVQATVLYTSHRVDASPSTSGCSLTRPRTITCTIFFAVLVLMTTCCFVAGRICCIHAPLSHTQACLLDVCVRDNAFVDSPFNTWTFPVRWRGRRSGITKYNRHIYYGCRYR